VRARLQPGAQYYCHCATCRFTPYTISGTHVWDPSTAVEIGVQTPFGRLVPTAVELNRGAGVGIVQYPGEHGVTVSIRV
jgi:hypothetical protein